ATGSGVPCLPSSSALLLDEQALATRAVARSSPRTVLAERLHRLGRRAAGWVIRALLGRRSWCATCVAAGLARGDQPPHGPGTSTGTRSHIAHTGSIPLRLARASPPPRGRREVRRSMGADRQSPLGLSRPDRCIVVAAEGPSRVQVS